MAIIFEGKSHFSSQAQLIIQELPYAFSCPDTSSIPCRLPHQLFPAIFDNVCLTNWSQLQNAYTSHHWDFIINVTQGSF